MAKKSKRSLVPPCHNETQLVMAALASAGDSSADNKNVERLSRALEDCLRISANERSKGAKKSTALYHLGKYVSGKDKKR